MNTSRPIFYSFRRCPYAMRARLALHYAGCEVEHREIVLKDKPPEMLEASPKGTVPVMVFADGRVIDESLDIMKWAAAQNDPKRLLDDTDFALIEQNDRSFKPQLDRYKYPSRFPDEDCNAAQGNCAAFFALLDDRLKATGTLGGLTDYAIFPFIRQCANVDKNWFDALPYDALKTWLAAHLESAAFQAIMTKYPVWKN